MSGPRRFRVKLERRGALGAWIDALLGPRERCAAPAVELTWRQVLGFSDDAPATRAGVEARFRRLAAAAHPDRGGTTDQMQRLIRARADARRQLAG